MKIKMIRMSKHPVSMMYHDMVIPSWKKAGYNVEMFEAITPADLPYLHQLIFGKKTFGAARPFTETEKAVWYSHFMLWKECACSKESYLIIEHDSKLVNPLPNLKNDDIRILSYATKDFDSLQKKKLNKIVTTSAPGSGYFIHPNMATMLIGNAVKEPINKNSDGHILQHAGGRETLRKRDYMFIEQVNIDGLNTIDHAHNFRSFDDPTKYY